MEQEITKASFLKALAQLPEKDRLIIALYYYENLTFVEIGSILDMSTEDVSKCMSIILTKIKKQTKEEIQ